MKNWSLKESPSNFLIKSSSFFSAGKGKLALDIFPEAISNALYLKQLGYRIEHLEKDKESANHLVKIASELGIFLKFRVADPSRIRLSKETYDLITCFFYVERGLIFQFKQALRKGGIVCMQAHTQTLKPKELLFFFKGYEILLYEESVVKGNLTAGVIAQMSHKSG